MIKRSSKRFARHGKGKGSARTQDRRVRRYLKLSQRKMIEPAVAVVEDVVVGDEVLQ